MEWIALFIGQLASGLNARRALLSYRGGILFQEVNSYSNLRNYFELLGTVVGIAGFIVSFFLFPWWVPIVAFVFGFWVVPPFAVSNATFVAMNHISPFFSLVSCGCGAFLIYYYFA